MDMCQPKLVLVALERKVAAVSAVWSLELTARQPMITKLVASSKLFTCQDEGNCQRLAN